MMKILLLLATFVMQISAHASYVALLPNGAAVVVNGKKIAALGHSNVNGGGTRNR
jgi:hypothetical protein